jgi:hypothetical protein
VPKDVSTREPLRLVIQFDAGPLGGMLTAEKQIAIHPGK